MVVPMPLSTTRRLLLFNIRLMIIIYLIVQWLPVNHAFLVVLATPS